MPRVSVHPEAYAELEAARSWYEAKAENLGNEFLDEIDRAIATIRESPSTWPLYHRGLQLRRFLVHRFPFGGIYREKPSEIQVIKVAESAHLVHNASMSRIDTPVVSLSCWEGSRPWFIADTSGMAR